MRKGIVPLDWKLIGAMLANEDCTAQVEFFKQFIEEMRLWNGTNYQIHSQLISIAKELPGIDRELWSFFCDKHGGN